VATDPSTGIAYIPKKEDFDFSIYSYNTFDFEANNPKITRFGIAEASYRDYGVVWSTVRKSILVYGGTWQGISTPAIPVLDLMEYQPSNRKGTAVKTEGATTPGTLSAPCMAS
ncbi:hypothetical protein BGZ68_004266, partial [Mortierella alpina]